MTMLRKNARSYLRRTLRQLGSAVRMPTACVHRCQKRALASSSSTPPSESEVVAFFSNILPEKSSSAAGVRTLSLMEDFAQRASEIHYAHQAKKAARGHNSGHGGPVLDEIMRDLEPLNIRIADVPLNDTKAIYEYLTTIERKLDWAIFDRFYLEEAYSHAVRNISPDTTLVLDMQDMHSLRRTRQNAVKQFAKDGRSSGDPLSCVADVMKQFPTAQDTNLVRELSSIHRCDLTFVCSPVEMELLQSEYGIPEDKLCLASFSVSQDSAEMPSPQDLLKMKSLEAPEFVFCGGFLHDPNRDAVEMLARHIWPKVKARAPNATLHIYGAYCPTSIKAEFHRPSGNGIHIHGFEPNLDTIFSPGRILLAPLRFGAGIKGKIIEAWQAGLPVVTTPIGSEGMTIPAETHQMGSRNGTIFGGYVAYNLDDFCQASIDLVEESNLYREAVFNGKRILKENFSSGQDDSSPINKNARPNPWTHVWQRLCETRTNLATNRQKDLTQAMLWYHKSRSTEYFSRWIETKSKLRRTLAKEKPTVETKIDGDDDIEKEEGTDTSK